MTFFIFSIKMLLLSSKSSNPDLSNFFFSRSAVVRNVFRNFNHAKFDNYIAKSKFIKFFLHNHFATKTTMYLMYSFIRVIGTFQQIQVHTGSCKYLF